MQPCPTHIVHLVLFGVEDLPVPCCADCCRPEMADTETMTGGGSGKERLQNGVMNVREE